MGLFTKKDPAAKLTGLQEKARAKAEKAGVDMTGAVAVAHDLGEDGAHQTLVVFPDRVELHNHGKVGTMTRAGAGVATVPASQIVSVSWGHSGIWGVVKVSSAAGALEFRTDQTQAPALADAIRSVQPA